MNILVKVVNSVCMDYCVGMASTSIGYYLDLYILACICI